MTEYDYSKWDNKPREMWVWNEDESKKHKRLVVFISPTKPELNRVLSVIDNKSDCYWFKHCAEIESSRRMTNYELAHWLWEGTQKGEFRECKLGTNCYTEYVYDCEAKNECVPEFVKIRINGGEWKEPLVEE